VVCLDFLEPSRTLPRCVGEGPTNATSSIRGLHLYIFIRHHLRLSLYSSKCRLIRPHLIYTAQCCMTVRTLSYQVHTSPIHADN
jgi:hypothetical protein